MHCNVFKIKSQNQSKNKTCKGKLCKTGSWAKPVCRVLVKHIKVSCPVFIVFWKLKERYEWQHWRISWHFQIVIRTKSTRRCNLRNTAKKFVCIQFLSIQRTTRYSSNVFLWAAVQLWGAGRWTSKVATFPTLDIWPRFAARHNKVQPCILTLCLFSPNIALWL